MKNDVVELWVALGFFSSSSSSFFFFFFGGCCFALSFAGLVVFGGFVVGGWGVHIIVFGFFLDLVCLFVAVVILLFVCRFEGLSTGPSSLPTRDLFPFTIPERSSFPTTVAAGAAVSFECSVQMNYF